MENSDFGKIVFNEYLNVTEDDDISDNVLDLDTNVEISSNLIVLNSTALPNFNVSSMLSLYNLNFSNPQILRDGAVCSMDICTEINYSGGSLMFNVTRFSNYSARETPVDVVPPPSRGGGSTRPAGDLVEIDTCLTCRRPYLRTH